MTMLFQGYFISDHGGRFDCSCALRIRTTFRPWGCSKENQARLHRLNNQTEEREGVAISRSLLLLELERKAMMARLEKEKRCVSSTAFGHGLRHARLKEVIAYNTERSFHSPVACSLVLGKCLH